MEGWGVDEFTRPTPCGDPEICRPSTLSADALESDTIEAEILQGSADRCSAPGIADENVRVALTRLTQWADGVIDVSRPRGTSRSAHDMRTVEDYVDSIARREGVEAALLVVAVELANLRPAQFLPDLAVPRLAGDELARRRRRRDAKGPERDPRDDADNDGGEAEFPYTRG